MKANTNYIFANSAFGLYLRSLDNQKRITKNDEFILADRIAEGGDNTDAIGELARANTGLVIDMARKYEGYGNVSFPDLVCAGNVGMMIAVNRFRSKKGANFATYAQHWIKQRILLALAKSRPLSTPPNAVGEMLKIRRVYNELERKLGRTPTCKEVSRATKFSVPKVKRYLFEMVDNVASLDEIHTWFDDSVERQSLHEIIAHPGDDPCELLCKKEEDEISKGLLDKLPENLRDVLVRRLDLDEKGYVESSEEVGKSHNRTGACIRLQQEFALNMLARILGHRLKTRIVRKKDYKIKSKIKKKERRQSKRQDRKCTS